MRRIATAMLVVLMSLVLTASVFAGDTGKDECVAKSKEAAQLIDEKGLESAIQVINDKNGPLVTKNTYVFLMDMEGKMVAHPMKPSLIGKNLIETKDKSGKLFFKEFIDVANAKGEGWVEYMWPKPGEEAPSEKVSYIYRIPGKDLVVGAGVYK